MDNLPNELRGVAIKEMPGQYEVPGTGICRIWQSSSTSPLCPMRGCPEPSVVTLPESRLAQ
eukprot:4607867-Amphidinium_carterae.1